MRVRRWAGGPSRRRRRTGAVEGQPHRLGAADAAVAHLLPHKVAVAEHPRQDDLAAERLGDAEQRADDLGAVRRLLQVVPEGGAGREEEVGLVLLAVDWEEEVVVVVNMEEVEAEDVVV